MTTLQVQSESALDRETHNWAAIMRQYSHDFALHQMPILHRGMIACIAHPVHGVSPDVNRESHLHLFDARTGQLKHEVSIDFNCRPPVVMGDYLVSLPGKTANIQPNRTMNLTAMFYDMFTGEYLRFGREHTIYRYFTSGYGEISPITATDNCFYIATPGGISGYNLLDDVSFGQEYRDYKRTRNVSAPLLARDRILYKYKDNTGDYIRCYFKRNLIDRAWEKKLDHPSATFDLAGSGELVYFWTEKSDHQYLNAISIRDGKLAWQKDYKKKAKNAKYIPPTVSGSTLCYITDDGYLHHLDAKSGDTIDGPFKVHKLGLPVHKYEPETTRGFHSLNDFKGRENNRPLSYPAILNSAQNDTEAFQPAMFWQAEDGSFCEFNLEKHLGQKNHFTLTSSDQNDPVQAYVFGQGDKSVYYANDCGLASDHYVDVTHRFNVDASLMVDDYHMGSHKLDHTAAKDPVYRVRVQVLDDQQSPRANVGIQVRSEQDVTIQFDHRFMSISQNVPGNIRTGTDGVAIFTVRCDDIHTPYLRLWSDFMPEGTELIVYPDQVNVDNLRSKQTEDIASANNFAGESVFKESDDATVAAIHQTLQNSLGADPESKKRSDEPMNAFVAHPQTDSCCMTRDAHDMECLREYYHSASCVSGVHTFHGNGASSFEHHDDETVRRRVNTMQRSLVDDFLGFLNDVVKTGEKIAQITWTLAREGAEWMYAEIKTVGDAVYGFVVNTIERGMAILKSMFDQVARSLKHVIEWLSFLFNWDDIKYTQQYLAQHINDGMDTIAELVASKSDQWVASVQAMAHQMKHQADSAFDHMRSKFGEKALNEQTQQNADVRRVYGHGKDNISNQSNWLTDKMKTGDGTVSVQQHGVSHRTASFAKADAGVFAVSPSYIDAYNRVFTDLHEVMSNVSSNVKNDLLDAFERMGDEFSRGVHDVTDFMNGAIRAFLDLIQGIVDSLIDVTEAVAEGLIRLLPDAFRLFKTLLNQEIDLPFIGTLYEKITGQKLTPINLATLLVAVPTTLIIKAKGDWDEFAGRKRGVDTSGALNIAYSCCYFVYTPFDMYLDWNDVIEGVGSASSTDSVHEPDDPDGSPFVIHARDRTPPIKSVRGYSIINLAAIALDASTIVLSWPNLHKENKDVHPIEYIISGSMSIHMLVNLGTLVSRNRLFRKYQPVVDSIYGVYMVILFVISTVLLEDEDGHDASDGDKVYYFFQNFAYCLPLMFKFLGDIDDYRARGILIGIDALGDISHGVMNAQNWNSDWEWS